MGFKRTFGWGTYFAVLLTGGLWLLALPFYPKRCVGCGFEEDGKKSNNVRAPFVALAMVVLVGLLVWAGVYNLRQRRLAMQQAQAKIVLVKDGTNPPAGSGSGSVDASAFGGESLKGKIAPGFTLVDLSGKKVSLADFKGHPVVINFWATYCGPCRLEMPWFQEFSGKYQPQGLIVLGVDQDEDMPRDQVAAGAKKTGVTYPILMPDKGIAKSYELGDYLPETFYVDKNGTVVEESVGTPSKDEVEANIRKAVGI